MITITLTLALALTLTFAYVDNSVRVPGTNGVQHRLKLDRGVRARFRLPWCWWQGLRVWVWVWVWVKG